MKMKVSDYIADFFAEHGIKNIYTVVGGGAMHLNDSFGHHPMLKCIYNHHEQASAMAAEAHFRVNNEMAGLCVTSGPGALNALNGVAGAYQDSIPMIVVSGQVKTGLMAVNSGLDLRTMGGQEFDICSALSKMAKYYTTVQNESDIRYCLEKAFYVAKTGRPGPCWLDIPVDIQGSFVETDELTGFEPLSDKAIVQKNRKRDSRDQMMEKIDLIFNRLRKAERPVFYAGNGIRISDSQAVMTALVERLNIPVVTCWNSIDLIETNHPLYVGRPGTMGDRPGNFAVQNSDLLICVGARLGIYQVGYNKNTWARNAYVVDVDIDDQELLKPTIRVDLPVCCDANEFLENMLCAAERMDCGANNRAPWLQRCGYWKSHYPVVEPRHYEDENPLNVYAFIDSFSKALPEGMITVVGNGSASVVGSVSYHIKKDSRFIMNCAMSSMGYDLPAAVGACVASGKKSVVCMTGDGSIMMNLQELQTIVTNDLPVKIIIINNEGYQQIRLTQTNLFHKNFVGLGPESGDLGFPDFEKIAGAFGIPFRRCRDMAEMKDGIAWSLSSDGYCMLEVMVTTKQIFEPKSATKRLEDGSLYSPPLEDLAPFLPRDELKENMYIPVLDEK